MLSEQCGKLILKNIIKVDADQRYCLWFSKPRHRCSIIQANVYDACKEQHSVWCQKKLKAIIFFQNFSNIFFKNFPNIFSKTFQISFQNFPNIFSKTFQIFFQKLSKYFFQKLSKYFFKSFWNIFLKVFPITFWKFLNIFFWKFGKHFFKIFIQKHPTFFLCPMSYVLCPMSFVLCPKVVKIFLSYKISLSAGAWP